MMESKDEVCVWRFADTDCPQWLWPWITECGGYFLLLEDDETLTEAGYLYCPKCSRRINVFRKPEGEK